MVNRIPATPGLPEAATVEGAGAADAAAALDATARAAETAAADAVSRIAAEVAAGRISRDEAVSRIVDEALASELVRAAPAELRAEIAAALTALVETDPYLQSLARGLGAAAGDDGA